MGTEYEQIRDSKMELVAENMDMSEVGSACRFPSGSCQPVSEYREPSRFAVTTPPNRNVRPATDYLGGK